MESLGTRPPSPPFGRAGAPFDQADADIILRSSDFVDFRVHKTILSVASPVFKDMLSLPQPSQPKDDECSDGLPVVMLEENAKTLELMLRTIYPVRSPNIEDLDDLYAVVRPVQKYCFRIFDGFVEEELTAVSQREPISVYAIACQYKFDDIVQRAAEASLALPSMTHSQYLKHISGEQYFHLIQYHRDCADAVDKVLASDQWFATCPDTMFDGSPPAPCSTCFTEDSVNPSRSPKPWQAPQQLWEYLARVSVALKERPSSVTVANEPIEVPTILHCQHPNTSGKQDPSNPLGCHLWDTRNGMSQFRHLLEEVVDKAVATVPSPKVYDPQTNSWPVAVSELSKSGHASSPFDEADADVILRSSDHVDFRVHKVILSLASPVFKDMFNLPPPSHLTDTDEPDNGLQVIALEEDADTLDFVLRNIYPVPSAIVAKTDDLRFVLGPSQKYRFKVFDGCVEASLRKAMRWEPHSVYAIACQYGFVEAAVEAACASLALPSMTPSRFLCCISGEQYFHLLRYHRKCAAAATEVVASQDWFRHIPDCIFESDTPCSSCFVQAPSQGKWRAPEYVWTWLTRVGQALDDRPTVQCIKDDKGNDFSKFIVCKHIYGWTYYRDTTTCLVRLQSLLSKEVSKVIALIPPPAIVG